ncbi:peptidase, M48 family [Acetobacteraceae bacterium AT-5844]|nr:peptidase, M48 family [Acetobacteraceae bacterium AT-5844]
MDRFPEEPETPAVSWRGPKLVALAVLLPLAFAALGFWERDRAASFGAEQAEARLVLEATVERLRQIAEEDPRAAIRLGENGRLYGASLAARMSAERLEQLDADVQLGALRAYLPPVAIGAGGLAALLGALGLAGAVLLGRAGRASRARLLAGFNLVRRGMPFFMAAQIGLTGLAVLTILAFEASALWQSGRVSDGDAKLMTFAAVLGFFALALVVSALWQLRRALRIFEPEPIPLLGREVGREDAAGLWRTVLDLAARAGAEPPQHLVVGLADGFFATSGDIMLRPEERLITGRTLHVPLPHLALIDTEEAAAIIGHELGHFSGADTEYSRRFVPIYAGVSRSLEAVAESEGQGNAFSLLLTRPALMLGLFVMEQFDHAVHHWSRQREFAADAVGARLTSNRAAASALLRSSAILPRIHEVLTDAVQHPASCPQNLLPAILAAAAQRGVDDPRAHLEDRQPHPTDTHPPTIQRLAALGQLTPNGPEAGVLAHACRAVMPEAPTALDAAFADPDALGRTLTTDFIGAVKAREDAVTSALEEAVAAVPREERAIFENTAFAAGVFGVLGLLALGAAGFLLWHARVEEQLVTSASLTLVGLGVLGFALWFHRRGRRPVLVLRATGFRSPGLAEEVPWLDVADFTVFTGRSLRAEFLIALGRPMPRKVSRRAKVDASNRLVVLPSAGLRGLKPQAYADLLGTYWRAAMAREELARRDATGHMGEGVERVPGTPA